METDAVITLAVVVGVLLILIWGRIGPDLVFLAGLTVLLTLGVLDPKHALAGFANEGPITVGVLFVVAAALRETGGMSWVTQKLLGRPQSITGAQTRLLIPTGIMSAVMNNTPLVAMMMPVVSEWSKKLGISVSKLMMPLSFAAILGGLCTLIGTSTNLVVHGLLLDYERAHDLDARGIGMFDITLVGIPCAIVGLVYILIASKWLLPDRKPAVSAESDPREYSVEMVVEPGSALDGKTIEDAGLRQLAGMYLMEIERDGEIFPMVGPEQKLEGNDRLVFVGVVDSVVDLQKIRGLRPATEQVSKLNVPRINRQIVEAVVSDSCRLVGQTIRKGQFRSVYNAVVIAVARNGERIRKKVGDIILRRGDTLLLEASPSFTETHRNSRDFYLVSKLEGVTPPRHERAWIALAILGAMVVSASTGLLSMLNAALLAGGLMVLTRCINGPTARRSVDWQILLVIGAALGIGKAMETSGAAEYIVDHFISLAGNNPLIALAVIYGLTMIFTEMMTHAGAAALMFPIALVTANSLDVNHMPFLMAIMIGASCGFATPISYQTNMMVFGPGGYQFTDYLRFGGILNLLIWGTTVAIAPLVWPF